MSYIVINQNFFLKKDAKISVEQRGFRFADGIFETCKIFNNVIFNFENHKARINNGLKTLEIQYDANNLEKICYSLIKKNQIKNGSLRISITRGKGSIGYLPKNNIKPLIIIETSKNKIIKPKIIRLGISNIKTNQLEENLKFCKTNQALNYILAKINATKSQNFDDIMLDNQGFIAETSSANIFWIKDKKIYTPSLKCDFLLGTTRKFLLENFDKKIYETEISLKDLANIDEIFITNSSLLALAIDELKINNKIIKFKKEISLEIENWFKKVLKEKCRSI